MKIPCLKEIKYLHFIQVGVDVSDSKIWQPIHLHIGKSGRRASEGPPHVGHVHRVRYVRVRHSHLAVLLVVTDDGPDLLRETVQSRIGHVNFFWQGSAGAHLEVTKVNNFCKRYVKELFVSCFHCSDDFMFCKRKRLEICLERQKL